MRIERTYSFSNGGIPEVQRRAIDTRRAILDRSLARLVSEARKSRFYSQSLSGIEVVSIDDLPKLPILTTSDYVDNMFPYVQTMLTTDGFPGGTVSRTGGTTDKPKFAVWGSFDKDRQIIASLPMLETLGIAKGDRVANLLHVGNLYSGLLSVEHELLRMGIMSLPLSICAPEVLVQTHRAFAYNVIVIQPATAIPILRRALEIDPGLRVDKVIYGGQAMSEADKNWLRDELGAKRVASAIASNDGGPYGYQCDRMSGDIHHLMDEYNRVEIVDEDGCSVADGEPGRLITTNLQKYVVPLVRYEIGDMGRIVRGPCPCGRTDRRFEFLGRSKDGFILKGETTSYGEMKAALASLGLTELQIELDQVAGQDLLLVRYAAETPVDPSLLLRALDRRYSQIGLVATRFEQLPIGVIPRNPVSGKIVGLIDKRRGK